MPSASDGAVAERGGVGALFDMALGFCVWAAHLLTVYIAAALACAFELVAPAGRGAVGLLTLLVGVTVVAAGAAVWHGLRRWRGRASPGMTPFRARLTVGADAIATLAIVWQGFAFALIPACV